MKTPINEVALWSKEQRLGICGNGNGIGKTKGHKIDNPTSGIWNFQNHMTHMQETRKDWSFEDGSTLKRKFDFTFSHR
jgi:hypothetical protein